ncbi:MerR family transcriptional regulator [Cohnella lupini]|uniref:DNA-binding transcriptional MerR regulator n=1 Tax=Cohnella lupini TaxID=1294267 RepID=A0A3D9I2H0_9BACL|nr:MerR family transcriptional regulator [Cohnella lupini]RED55954.1 DNA-binding transcriptional MerR regulator [Cohnella lupini]
MKYNSIGEVSALFNIPESALRYYDKKGLLPLIERDDAGRRLFSERQMALLQAVVCFKNTHMPINSIRKYMEMIVEGAPTLERRLDMMREHKQRMLDEIALLNDYLPTIDEKIERYIKQIEEERP